MMSAELGVSMPRKAGPDLFLGDADAAHGSGHLGLLEVGQPVGCDGRVPGPASGDHGPAPGSGRGPCLFRLTRPSVHLPGASTVGEVPGESGALSYSSTSARVMAPSMTEFTSARRVR